MFNAKSSAIVCPACGQGNRASERFCTACAARLGAEPSIAPLTADATAPAVAAGHAADSFDTLRADHLRSSPRSAPARKSGVWTRLGIAGLVVMTVSIASSLHLFAGNKASLQIPMQKEGMAPVPAVTAARQDRSETERPDPSVAPAPVGPPAAVAASPSITSSTVPPAARPQRSAPEARSVRPNPERQASAREHVRPPPKEVSPADFGAWVAPSRGPGMTSSPNYQDAGPPVVQGPGPALSPGRGSEPGPQEPTVAKPTPGTGKGVAASGGADLGPPIVAGPGPRYEYATPNAAGR